MQYETQAAKMEEGCMEMEEGCMEMEEGSMEAPRGCVCCCVDELSECYSVCLHICYDLWYNSTCRRVPGVDSLLRSKVSRGQLTSKQLGPQTLHFGGQATL